MPNGLKNASDRQEEAETLKKEYESALSGAKEESVKIVENARVEAKRQSDEILADADRRADATIERARKTIETERKQALDGDTDTDCRTCNAGSQKDCR